MVGRLFVIAFTRLPQQYGDPLYALNIPAVQPGCYVASFRIEIVGEVITSVPFSLDAHGVIPGTMPSMQHAAMARHQSQQKRLMQQLRQRWQANDVFPLWAPPLLQQGVPDCCMAASQA